MTDKQKIKKMEQEIAELKMKVSLLEARPMIITVTPQPALAPHVPYMPSYPNPYIGDPYIGDPVYQTVTGGTQVRQNISSQSSNFVQ